MKKPRLSREGSTVWKIGFNVIGMTEAHLWHVFVQAETPEEACAIAKQWHEETDWPPDERLPEEIVSLQMVADFTVRGQVPQEE